MALDTKLKSDMASTTSSFAETADTTTPKQATTPFSKVVFPVSEPAAAESEPTVLLKSIEKQLKELNQNVADLEQEAGTCKAPDYSSIFSKIDSARCSIERVVSGIGTTSSGTVDKSIFDKITDLEMLINGVVEKQDRNDRQLAQTLRENANFQIQVRQGMQHDIDAFKSQQSGEQFNPILKEIASMYVEYQSILEDESISDLSKKNLKALFEQFEDLLFDYDAEISRSEVGAVRQTRSTKIIGKIPTGDQAKHNTVAFSRKPGVLRGRTVLYPEFVDVFVFDPTIVVKSSEEETSQEAEVEGQSVAEEKLDEAVPIIKVFEAKVSGMQNNAEELNVEEISSDEASAVNSENG